MIVSDNINNSDGGHQWFFSSKKKKFCAGRFRMAYITRAPNVSHLPTDQFFMSLTASWVILYTAGRFPFC